MISPTSLSSRPRLPTSHTTFPQRRSAGDDTMSDDVTPSPSPPPMPPTSATSATMDKSVGVVVGAKVTNFSIAAIMNNRRSVVTDDNEDNLEMEFKRRKLMNHDSHHSKFTT